MRQPRAGGSRRVLIAPDAFKGTLSAAEVAAAIARGLRRAGAEAEECPVADGGEGTIEVLRGTLGGELREASSHDALGRPLAAQWLWLADQRTAILEMARASGLALIAPGERDAEAASSAGTGELILAALRAGARRAILAIGGTATSDGGAGALATIEQAGGIGELELELACDVMIAFESAAEVFGPQKGASPEQVIRLTERLLALARELPRDPRGLEMTGAGGGLAGALWAVHDARLTRGATFVLEALDFDRRLASADAVVIGEGCLDEQSTQGKITGAIIARAAARGVPVHAVVGGLAPGSSAAEWGQLASLQIAGTPGQLELAGAVIAALRIDVQAARPR
jgi:glycerate kinase